MQERGGKVSRLGVEEDRLRRGRRERRQQAATRRSPSAGPCSEPTGSEPCWTRAPTRQPCSRALPTRRPERPPTRGAGQVRVAERRRSRREGQPRPPRKAGRGKRVEDGSYARATVADAMEHVRADLAVLGVGGPRRRRRLPAAPRAGPARRAGADGPHAVHPDGDDHPRRAAPGRRVLDVRVRRRTDVVGLRLRRPLPLGHRPGGAGSRCSPSCSGQLLLRRSPWRIFFNIGQYTLSLLAAWGVLVVAGGLHRHVHRPDVVLHPGPELDRAVVGGFYLVNLALVAGTAATEGQSWWEAFTEDFRYCTFSMFAVLAMAPFVVVMAAVSWQFVPLLLLPLFAVYKTASLALRAGTPGNARRADRRCPTARPVRAAARGRPRRVRRDGTGGGRVPARPRSVQGGQRHPGPPRG